MSRQQRNAVLLRFEALSTCTRLTYRGRFTRLTYRGRCVKLVWSAKLSSLSTDLVSFCDMPKDEVGALDGMLDDRCSCVSEEQTM